MIAPSPGLAQLAGDRYYDFERQEPASRGSDDSTTGSSVIFAEEAGIEVVPPSLSWNGEPSAGETPKLVTVTNSGRLLSLGQITVTLSNSNFTLVGNGCSSLTSGQSCEISVRPRSGLTGNFDGQIVIRSESGKTRNVPLTANLVPPAPPVPPTPTCGNFIQYRTCTGSRVASPVAVRSTSVNHMRTWEQVNNDAGQKCRNYCQQFSATRCCAFLYQLSGVHPCIPYTGSMASYQYSSATTCLGN